MTELLLGWLGYYGLPVYVGAIVLASAGIPFPASLMLILTGAFVEAGEMDFWAVVLLGIGAAVLGDNIGYAVGRYGGRGVVEWMARRLNAVSQLGRAEAFIERWGALAVFFSRWLATFLGRWTNLTMGATFFSWPKFLFWDVLGEIIWVILYISLGRFFSDRVREVAELTSDVSYALFGLLVSILLAWLLLRSIRRGTRPIPAA